MSETGEKENGKSSVFPELRDDRYKPIKLLGKGRSGVVFLAKDENLGRKVVVKSLRSELASGEEVQRFQREAQTLSSLNHPGILQVRDFGIMENQTPYLVTDYVEGKTLYDLLLERTRLDEDVTITIARQICQAMGHAHNKGIIHRDLKPHNILTSRKRDDSLHVTIFDFGLAKRYSRIELEGAGLTHPGQILGTAEYMSPEQANGKNCTVESDIYSLGCIMFELLSGKAPFEADSLLEVITKQVSAPPPIARLKEKNPHISNRLVEIIGKMLAKEPLERYHSMLDIDAALEDLEHKHRLELASSRARMRSNTLEQSLPELTDFSEYTDERGEIYAEPAGDGEELEDELEEFADELNELEDDEVPYIVSSQEQTLVDSHKQPRQLKSDAVLMLAGLGLCAAAIIAYLVSIIH